jgi:hypothetical protein
MNEIDRTSDLLIRLYRDTFSKEIDGLRDDRAWLCGKTINHKSSLNGFKSEC